jgi:hypothetical protein
MATELEQALFDEELEAVRNLPEFCRWQLERDPTVPLGLYVVMHPVREPTELYKARIRWTDYFGPFSLKFVDLATNADTAQSAWPKCFGFRPGALDACLPWTAEGHGHHPDWKNSAANSFPKVELPLQYALLQVQSSLDNSYEGRGP